MIRPSILPSRSAATHELKILPQYFEDILHNSKNFEIRKNDRNYKVGDILILEEWDNGKYTGRKVTRSVGYITDYAQKDNYVVMGLRK